MASFCNDVLKCLGNRPSILKAREIGEKIVNWMKEFVVLTVQLKCRQENPNCNGIVDFRCFVRGRMILI